MQKRQAEFEQRQAAGELTDEELEAISGGITPSFFFLSLAISAGTALGAGMTYQASQQW